MPYPSRPPQPAPPSPSSGAASADAKRSSQSALGQCLRDYGVITGGTLAIEHGGRLLGWSAYTHLCLAALFLLFALHRAQASGPQGLKHHGLWLGGLLAPTERPRSGPLGPLWDLTAALLRAIPSAFKEASLAIVFAALTFPPFCVAFYWFHQPDHAFVFRPPTDTADYLLAQLLLVALPEEALFRGYFQTHLSDHFSSRRSLLRVPISWPALVLQGLLFAVLHVAVTPHPARLLVFFPGLLFGWLRAARGGIGTATVYHVLCNLLSDVLARGFL